MNEIVKHNENFNATLNQAETLQKSGFLPTSVDSPQKAFAIITLGQELGLKPWQSLLGINVIKGRPVLSAQMMLSLVRASGLLENIKIDSTNDRCIIFVKRKGEEPYEEVFSIEDAKKAGLTSNPLYAKYPKRMLYARCISFALRTIFPEVLLGLLTPEEVEEIVDSQENHEVMAKVSIAKEEEEEEVRYVAVESPPKNGLMSSQQRKMIWGLAKQRFKDLEIDESLCAVWIRKEAVAFGHDSASKLDSNQASQIIKKLENATAIDLKTFADLEKAKALCEKLFQKLAELEKKFPESAQELSEEVRAKQEGGDLSAEEIDTYLEKIDLFGQP